MYQNSRLVGEYFGVSGDVVLKFGKKIGYDTSKKLLITEKEIQEIIDLYNEKTAKELSEQYNVSISRISQIWRQNGLKGKDQHKYKIGNIDCFKNLDAESAYLMGFIGADGCIYQPKDNRQKILSISLHKKDIEILELFRKKIQTDKPITHLDDYVSLQISSNVICEDIEKYNITSNKTYGNSIPDVDEKYYFHMIRGYLDGDGTIRKKTRKDTKNDVIVSIAGFECNMNKIIEFLYRKNILAEFCIDDRKNKYSGTGNFGNLVLTNKLQKYCFLKSIYANCGDFYMIRKKIVADEFIENIENSNLNADRQTIIYYKYAVQSIDPDIYLNPLGKIGEVLQ